MKECKRVRGLLALRSDDWSAEEQARVEAHLATCPDCVALVHVYDEQDCLIRNAPRVGLTPSQRDQLLSRIRRERRRNEMRTRLSATLGTTAAIAALAALAFGLNALFRPSGPSVPSAPTGPYPANADEALWVHIDAAWDKELAHQTTAILQRQPWWDGEIILFTYEDNLPDSAGGGHQQVLSWILVEADPLEPGWTVVASGNKEVIHWPVEQAMPTPADVGVYSFFLSQRQDNLGRALSVIYGLWVGDLVVPDTVQLTLGGQELDAPLENESFLYVTEGHIAGQRPQIRWTCDSPGGTPCVISLRTEGLSVEEYALEETPQVEPLTFAPVEGSAREILSRHQDERRRYFPDRSFSDDGHFALAVSLGNERLVATEIFTNTGNTEKGTVEVSRDGETIYTIQGGDPSPITTLRGLWVYDNHWVLEVANVTEERNSQNEVSLDAFGQIIQDGEPLNERYGYQEAFGFQMMRGKPFYFFKKDSQIGISYDNQAVPLGYSQVPHYWCCSGAELNPLSAENMVAFFAWTDGVWYYVEVGVFE